MQRRRIYNNYSLSGVFSLLMMMTVSAMAQNSDSYYTSPPDERLVNPWLLPQAPIERPLQVPGQAPGQTYGGYSEYQVSPGYDQQDVRRKTRGQSQQDTIWQNPHDQFVTPDILESLKQQQRMYQTMPGNQPRMNDRRWPQSQPYMNMDMTMNGSRQPQAQPFMQMPLNSRLPGQGIYSAPSYGAGGANPLYDTPAVSPWGNGPDVLYRGESLPMVPSEALGGFPPMHVPSFGMNTYKNTGSDVPVGADESNVFNPFTFLPGDAFSRP
jgi:hypothetical protein